VLDPFCGTGTTALACAERGVSAHTTDINPFLVWFARTKTRRYSAAQRARVHELGKALGRKLPNRAAKTAWTPPLHKIERWWETSALAALATLMRRLTDVAESEDAAVSDLLKVAFCQTLISAANVSFGHQSMSFAKRAGVRRATREAGDVETAWLDAVTTVGESASSAIGRLPRVRRADARELDRSFEPNRFTRVITSPPYPNRMSYVRELRPYMYWLGFLSDGRAAGELDWEAIGGTWGTATSRVARWEPAHDDVVCFDGFTSLIGRIDEKSPVLARYVHKYFCDMARHCRAISRVLKPGGRVDYIVGNSKFYEVLVPVERIFAALFEASGLVNARILRIRKRTSKPELFEFVVSAEKPAAAARPGPAGE
jgi:DNA modification methylase